MQVPDDNGVAEALHGLSIAHHLAEIHHVVVPASKRGRHQHVTSWQGARIVTITVREVARLISALQVVIGWHPYTGDEITAVGVLRHTRAATVVAIIRQARNQHASRQRIIGMGSDYAARFVDEVINGAVQLGRCRVSVNIKNEDFAGIQTRRPQKTAVIGQAGVVRFVAAAHGDRVNDLCVGLRVGVHIYRDQFVLTIANALKAQCPDVHVIFLTHDLRHVR